MPQTQKERIHAALVSAISSGTFYAITYSAAGALTHGAAVQPASVRINEVSSSFREDPVYRRGFRQDRTSWRWKAHVSFHGEASLEAFEEALLLDPPTLARSAGLRQVRLLLLDATYTHPVQHQAASGTTAVYTFEASQAPA